MTKRFKLLLDMDDVITKTLEEALELNFKKNGVLYLPGNVTNWTFLRDKSIFKDVFHQKDFYKKLQTKKDSVEFIEKWLNEDVFDIEIITACLSNEAYRQKLLWVKKHIPSFPRCKVFSVLDKSKIRGDLLVDDGLHNIRAFDKTGRDTLLYTMGHNKKDSKFKRVSSFKEVDEYIYTNWL